MYIQRAQIRDSYYAWYPQTSRRENTPVLGTNVKARDIAITSSVCRWNPDMYGVDATKPEGQAYYNSIIQMYADWGVDFIKVDDISRPYDDIQKAGNRSNP